MEKSQIKYPSKTEIWDLFTHLSKGDNDAFFARVAPDVDWTIMGTSPLSRRFTSLRSFQDSTLSRLKHILKPPGLIMKVHNVIGGGEGWATAELRADCECINGRDYNMSYAWCVRFDEGGKIVQVRAYLDTKLLTDRLEECEEGEVEVFVTPRDF